MLAALGVELVRPGIDAHWALGWGQTLAGGERPLLDENPPQPTRHPLTLAIGVALAPLGPAAATAAFAAIAALAYGLLAYACFRLGVSLALRHGSETSPTADWVTPVAGVLAAALVALNPEVIAETMRAGKDVLAAAPAVLGVAMAAEDPRRNWARAAGLVSLAALVRPELWLLVALVLTWAGLRGAGGRASAAAALLLAAPAIWLACGLVLSGDPLHAAKRIETQRAERRELRANARTPDDAAPDARGGGPGGALEAAVEGVPGTIGWLPSAFGLTGLAVAASDRRRRAPWLLAAAAIGASVAAAALLGLAGIVVVPRFLLPAAALAAALAGGAAFLLRRGGGLAALGAAGLVAGGAWLALGLGDAERSIDELTAPRRTLDRLFALAGTTGVREAAEACTPVVTAAETRRAAGAIRPYVGHALEVDPGRISFVRTGPPEGFRGTWVTLLHRPGLTPRPALRDGAWRIFVACRSP